MTDPAPTVLIVEDQRGLAEAYQTVVATAYETRLATSGPDALDVIDESVDVVLLDRRMPGMSGDEVLVEFDDRGYTAMVAMITAVEPAVDIVELPFDEYVTKPIDNDELLALIDTLLRRREYDDKLREFCSLAAKKSALETVHKEGTPEYDQLVGRLRTLREQLGAALERLPKAVDPRPQAD